jgi:hypothetical protein
VLSVGWGAHPPAYPSGSQVADGTRSLVLAAPREFATRVGGNCQARGTQLISPWHAQPSLSSFASHTTELESGMASHSQPHGQRTESQRRNFRRRDLQMAQDRIHIRFLHWLQQAGVAYHFSGAGAKSDGSGGGPTRKCPEPVSSGLLRLTQPTFSHIKIVALHCKSFHNPAAARRHRERSAMRWAKTP